MERQRIDENWKVSPLTGWWIRQKETLLVNLPYDASVHGERRSDAPCEAHGGFFPGGTYHYDKVLFIPKEWKGRKIYLEFEGVYMNTAVRVNDNAVGRHPYGYTGFLCDITDYLFYGEDNAVRVVVSNGHQPNARWYTGTGIYRHVWLVSGGPVRIAPHGLFVTTPEVSSERAVVSLAADAVNDTAEKQHALLRVTVFDGETVVALDEQAQSLADYVVGKTIPEVKGISISEEGKPTGADLTASVTMSIGGYISAIEQAAANASHLGASKGDRLVLTTTTNAAKSTDATSDADGLAQAYATVGALTLSGDTITSMVIDAVQANVNFNAAGTISTDLSAAQPSKNELGADYGMGKVSSIGKEWDEQAAAFASYVTGKTVAEATGIAVTEEGNAGDADLAASVTIGVGDFLTLVEKAGA